MRPSKFRKKPVVIEAIQWTGDALSATEAITFVLDGDGTARYHDDANPFFIAIDTLEGTMHALAGDWIIKGVAGESYPCKPAIFEATYERADWR